MKRPKSWRKGQTIFNFLEWLRVKGYIDTNQNKYMADPFYISDKDWNYYYRKFIEEMNEEN